MSLSCWEVAGALTCDDRVGRLERSLGHRQVRGSKPGVNRFWFSPFKQLCNGLKMTDL